MTQTRLMQADEIASSFNSVAGRGYWRASVAGGRLSPEVNFNSRSTMVCVTYRIATDDFTVTFRKTNAAFGDFLASTNKALLQVLGTLQAAGLDFECPFLDPPPVLRIEYAAHTKQITIHMAREGDGWRTAEPIPFKVPERKNDENALSGLDVL